MDLGKKKDADCGWLTNDEGRFVRPNSRSIPAVRDLLSVDGLPNQPRRRRLGGKRDGGERDTGDVSRSNPSAPPAVE
jgi:hypothetical protein